MKQSFSAWLTSAFSPSVQRGQVLLIVVLVMVVALTVGLSVATRSITNVRTTTEEENSQRAFSAAEAGIERALKEPAFTGNVNLQNNATIGNVVVRNITPNTSDYILRSTDSSVTAVDRNIGWDVWFADHNANGSINYSSLWPTTGPSSPRTIRFTWGTTQGSDLCAANIPALEVIFISLVSGQYITTHRTFDPCGYPGAVSTRNNFTTVPSAGYTVSRPGGGTITLRHRAEITDGANIIMAKVIPLYNDAVVAVSANPALPSQGQQIESTGESGETFRKITVNKPYPQFPSELFNVLFSP